MKSILGLYLLLWGLGMSIDPRLQDYKFVSAAGFGLLVAGWGLVRLDVDWSALWPREFLCKETDSRTSTSMLVVLFLLAGAGAAFYYYFYGLSP